MVARPGVLRLDRIVVRFGGTVAVDNMSLEVPTGSITGLIGPNGAGKTTLFNVAGGLLSPQAGRVYLDGTDLTHADPGARARAGLGRTFQRVQLCESLTVSENVRLAVEAGLAGASPLRQLAASPGANEVVSKRTTRALRSCGIEAIADLPVHAASTGQRRLTELARCLAAGPYRILLLDEPSSGLDRMETRQFGAILRRAVAERQIGVLIVDHDMSLVMDICDHVYVLDFGKHVFDGPPAQVQASPLVQAAYLGDLALPAGQEAS